MSITGGFGSDETRVSEPLKVLKIKFRCLGDKVLRQSSSNNRLAAVRVLLAGKLRSKQVGS